MMFDLIFIVFILVGLWLMFQIGYKEGFKNGYKERWQGFKSSDKNETT